MGRNPARLLQKLVKLQRLNGEKAEARQDFLLPQPIGKLLGFLGQRDEIGPLGRCIAVHGRSFNWE